MKRMICILLVCLLLGACGKEQTQPEATTEPPFEAQQPTLSPTEPEGDEEILAYRRDLVEAEMRRAMSILWTPEEDISYSLYSGSMGPEIDMQIVPDRVIHMKAGRIYQGVPYTHGSGSAYSFLDYATAQDENGVYTISNIGGESLTGYAQSGPWSQARLGSDCVDTLCWAWAKVSTSISFTGTGEMTEIYGCLKVGDYTCDLPKLTDSTKPVVQANGQDVMFEAYAQLQKGDGMVLYTKSSGGHAVMVVDAVVNYTEDGKINGASSYVTIIEHKSEPQKKEETYYNEQLGQDVYICGAVDSVWTFDTLYSKGYLPVTCKELIDPSPLPTEQVSLSAQPQDLESLFSEAVNATYRIASVTVTIRQGDKTIQKATCFGRQDNQLQLDMQSFLDIVEQAVILGSVDPDSLKPGTYQCTVTCRLATGNTHTVHEFDFSV